MNTAIWIVYEDCCGMDIKGAFWTEAEAKAFAKAGEYDLTWHVEKVVLPPNSPVEPRR